MGDQPRIQRLSSKDIARLRSTVSLTTLAGVVQELLMNSLDANATSVNISVNIVRNSMTVEDNGDGVVPPDIVFLGTRYSTSKSTFSPVPTFGYRGEFISSLATSSLLTIYSRSKHYRSTHAVRYHYGSRLICGQVENDTFMLRNAGTRIIVDRLFGNFPVRVMARDNMSAVEIAKDWKDIGRKIVEVLLLFERKVKVVVRDDKGARRAVFDLTEEEGGRERWGRVLEQAGYTRVPWENVEATWRGITLRGMMALAPAADTERQFIFLNGTPIAKAGNSIIYSKINGLFAASSFGMLDDSGAPGDGKRLVVRKGVEKHPSFVVFVQTSGGNTVHAEDLELDSGNTILLDVTKLLESTVDEFLRLGGWKRKVTPRKKADEDVDMMVDEGTPIRELPRRGDLSLDMVMSSRVKTSNGLKARKLDDNVPQGDIRKSIRESQRGPPIRPPDTQDVIHYFDESTNSYIPLDARTGNQIRTANKPIAAKRLSLASVNRAEVSPAASAWAASIVSSFKNPVYKNPEAPIPTNSTSTEDILFENNGSLARISKASLKTARVISQVDDKYILLALQSPELLVIVDQHAADERVRVERLWREYDRHPKPLKKPVSFTVASDEYNVLLLHLAEMQGWGFKFEITNLGGLSGGAKVDILGVPELVADRCVSEPTLVVGLVRNWIAELKEQAKGRIFPGGDDWIKRMVGATKWLAEVVSSRACRSAIMFNDKLTLEECENLMEQLSECDFPFQCAHGRPSMVPVIDLAGGGVEEGFELDKCGVSCSGEH
ncbi:hypothetical protein H072_589 [Dactylellina haptotyla CBS 200.50]|uniref:MutL C-terminal dimerisation domain-containing protein n=1 Tax=Dactylellina haptotyla (strain CBS 200.50) TaxID=1284197 RepID=S8AWU5_DACHA|nr:hypothetical protein H072_589 [Dactylellina haptotyla CBS 200.50]